MGAQLLDMLFSMFVDCVWAGYKAGCAAAGHAAGVGGIHYAARYGEAGGRLSGGASSRAC
jgi:hypothetical protein